MRINWGEVTLLAWDWHIPALAASVEALDLSSRGRWEPEVPSFFRGDWALALHFISLL